MVEIKLEKQLPIVQINFAEVKASLIAGSEKYRNLVVTKEGLKDCKTMQKELSSTRIKLDTYRKEIKKEMSKPITKFEDECKELIALVAEVENPLKEGIEVFNQKVRDANKELAESIIKTFIKEEKLILKYAEQLTVIDKYMNLTAKENEVTADIQQRGYLLLQQQETEIETLQIINDTIANLNKNIDAKLSLEDFQSLIDANTSPVKIMAEINARAERIKASELKAIADKAAAAEKEVLERIARAERETLLKAKKERELEEAKAREVAEKARVEESMRLKAIEEAKELEVLRLKAIENEAAEKLNRESKSREMSRNISLEPKSEIPVQEKRYFIEMRVEGNAEEIQALSSFLKENGYKYEATSKGLL